MFGRKKNEEEDLLAQANNLQKRIEEVKKKKGRPIEIPTAAIKQAIQSDKPIEAAREFEEETKEDSENDESPIEESNARIISVELLENGLMKYTFISSVKMGELGQEFAI